MARYETFYVYLHRRKTDGRIFYVGKGGGKRAYHKNGRTQHWKRVASKHGLLVEIYKEGLTHEEANALEIEMISSLRLEGHPIVNMTDGGEGRRLPHTKETIEKIRRAKEKKKVYCSNGMVFESCVRAAEWLREAGFYTARQSGVSSSCTGRAKSYLGFSWSYEGIPSNPEKSKKMPTEVECSNGMIFPSMWSAVGWLKENGHPKARQSAISAACDNEEYTRYGYTWKRV